MPDEIGRHLHRTRRNLPHWQVGGKSYYVTWNTWEGLHLTKPERQIVLNACRKFHRERYNVFAIVVMPDHVHMLIQPLQKADKTFWHLGSLLGGMKGASAREINRNRGRTGTLWQDESYDRILRSGKFEEKWEYIRMNPVRAALVQIPEDWDELWIPSTRDGWMPRSS